MAMPMPIIPRIGGKRWLANVLIPRFAPRTSYAEVYVASAVLSFMRPLADVEVLSDVDDELINPYSVLQQHLEEFVRQLKWALTSRRFSGF